MKFSLLMVFFIVGFSRFVFAQATTSVADATVDTLSQKLEETKADVEKLKNNWDKARLETTLYEQRAKRAYQKWVKATKAAKAKAQAARDKADLELQLAVERRKLAFSQWQAAQLRQASQEAQLKALGQDQDSKAIEAKIQQLQSKLNRLITPAVPTKP